MKNMPQIIKKRISIPKEIGFEELLSEEEAAIEAGRKAYMNGEWEPFAKVKNELGRTRNKTRAKKS